MSIEDKRAESTLFVCVIYAVETSIECCVLVLLFMIIVNISFTALRLFLCVICLMLFYAAFYVSRLTGSFEWFYSFSLKLRAMSMWRDSHAKGKNHERLCSKKTLLALDKNECIVVCHMLWLTTPRLPQASNHSQLTETAYSVPAWSCCCMHVFEK